MAHTSSFIDDYTPPLSGSSPLHAAPIHAIINHTSMWQVDALTEEKAVDDLRPEWLDLVDRSPSATIFQSYEWLMTWWIHLGKRVDRRLFVITVREVAEGSAAQGRLVGLAPFTISSWHGGPLRRLSFLGVGLSDYNDIVADPEFEEEVCSEIYDFLGASNKWHVADFVHLREGGVWRRATPAGSKLVWADFDVEKCPYLPLPTEGEDRWRTLLQRYPKKTRDHIGYYERRLASIYDVDNHIVTEPTELEDAMSALFELHARRWNKRWLPGVLGSKKIQDFHRAVAAMFLRRDWLRLHVLALDNDIQAVLYCYRSKDRTLYYQGGFEPTLSKLSLGAVLTGSAIRSAIDEGSNEFDFLRGDEPYKERWTRGEARMNIRRVCAKSGSPFLPLAVWAHRFEHGIESRFKDFMHHAYQRTAKLPAEKEEGS